MDLCLAGGAAAAAADGGGRSRGVLPLLLQSSQLLLGLGLLLLLQQGQELGLAPRSVQVRQGVPLLVLLQRLLRSLLGCCLHMERQGVLASH